MIEVRGKYTNAVIYSDNVDQKATKQIQDVCNLEMFKGCKIRCMPDIHPGTGCVIGFTSEYKDKIIPNICGVDLSCGVILVKLGKIDVDFKVLDEFIRGNIPYGFNVNEEIQPMDKSLYNEIVRISKLTGSSEARNLRSLGSNGSGNHYIECNEDSEGDKYLTIHSGSRNFGLQIAKYYQNLAIQRKNERMNLSKEKKEEIIKRLKAEGRAHEIQEVLMMEKAKMPESRVPDSLAHLEGQDAKDYLRDSLVAQEFANQSRINMARKIVGHLGLDYDKLESFTTIHNYINQDDNIIRKGAISAKKDELVIIPINMAEGSILARGKGNPEWNYSACHGAGRLLSRGAAKEAISLGEFEESMKDVYTTSVNQSTIDEAPMAYKPMDEIIENTKEAIEIVDILKPLYNFKA